jgi:thiamine-phosphate pyrophosphorylase
MRGLYAIIDADFLERRGVPLPAFAERVISAKPIAVQLRAKRAQPRDILTWLRTIRPAATAHGVLLFANDRPDLAVLSGCDGVHVGQRDLDVADVRRIAPGLRVGISTHDDAELHAALAARPEYVAFGPVFGTTSKERPEPVAGVPALARASVACRAAGIPLVAIGGIDEARAAEVAPLIDMGAIISGLLPEGSGLEDVTERAAALHRALCGS